MIASRIILLKLSQQLQKFYYVIVDTTGNNIILSNNNKFSTNDLINFCKQAIENEIMKLSSQGVMILHPPEFLRNNGVLNNIFINYLVNNIGFTEETLTSGSVTSSINPNIYTWLRNYGGQLFNNFVKSQGEKEKQHIVSGGEGV